MKNGLATWGNGPRRPNRKVNRSPKGEEETKMKNRKTTLEEELQRIEHQRPPPPPPPRVVMPVRGLRKVQRPRLKRVHIVCGIRVHDKHDCPAAMLKKGHDVDNRVPKRANIFHCGKCDVFFFY
jgi:hypothetical protein